MRATNRPMRAGDRVVPRRPRRGDPGGGRVLGVTRDCFGSRAVDVLWDSGVGSAYTQLCLTSDLRRDK